MVVVSNGDVLVR